MSSYSLPFNLNVDASVTGAGELDEIATAVALIARSTPASAEQLKFLDAALRSVINDGKGVAEALDLLAKSGGANEQMAKLAKAGLDAAAASAKAAAGAKELGNANIFLSDAAKKAQDAEQKLGRMMHLAAIDNEKFDAKKTAAELKEQEKAALAAAKSQDVLASGLLQLATSTGVVDYRVGTLVRSLTQMASGLGLSHGATAGLGTALSVLTNPLTIAAGGLGVLVGVGSSLYASFAHAAEATQDFAQRLGVTTQEGRDLENFAKIASVNIGTLTSSSRILSVALEDSGGAGKKAADSFARLGIDAFDASGAVRDEGQVLLDVLDKLSRVSVTSERMREATALLGRSSKEIIPLLNSYQQLRAESDRLGLSIEDSLLNKGAAFQQELNTLGVSWQSFKDKISQGFGPVFEEAIKGATDLIAALSKPFTINAQGVRRDAITNTGGPQNTPLTVKQLETQGNLSPNFTTGLEHLAQTTRDIEKSAATVARFDNQTKAGLQGQIAVLEKQQAELRSVIKAPITAGGPTNVVREARAAEFDENTKKIEALQLRLSGTKNSANDAERALAEFNRGLQELGSKGESVFQKMVDLRNKELALVSQLPARVNRAEAREDIDVSFRRGVRQIVTNEREKVTGQLEEAPSFEATKRILDAAERNEAFNLFTSQDRQKIVDAFTKVAAELTPRMLDTVSRTFDEGSREALKSVRESAEVTHLQSGKRDLAELDLTRPLLGREGSIAFNPALNLPKPAGIPAQQLLELSQDQTRINQGLIAASTQLNSAEKLKAASREQVRAAEERFRLELDIAQVQDVQNKNNDASGRVRFEHARERLDIERENQLKIAELQQKQQASFRDSVVHGFDDIISGNGGNIFKSFGLGLQRQIIGNLSDQIFPIISRAVPHIQTGPISKILEGTPFGPKPEVQATIANTAAHDKNSTALGTLDTSIKGLRIPDTVEARNAAPEQSGLKAALIDDSWYVRDNTEAVRELTAGIVDFHPIAAIPAAGAQDERQATESALLLHPRDTATSALSSDIQDFIRQTRLSDASQQSYQRNLLSSIDLFSRQLTPSESSLAPNGTGVLPVPVAKVSRESVASLPATKPFVSPESFWASHPLPTTGVAAGSPVINLTAHQRAIEENTGEIARLSATIRELRSAATRSNAGDRGATAQLPSSADSIRPVDVTRQAGPVSPVISRQAAPFPPIVSKSVESSNVSRETSWDIENSGIARNVSREMSHDITRAPVPFSFPVAVASDISDINLTLKSLDFGGSSQPPLYAPKLDTLSPKDAAPRDSEEMRGEYEETRGNARNGSAWLPTVSVLPITSSGASLAALNQQENPAPTDFSYTDQPNSPRIITHSHALAPVSTGPVTTEAATLVASLSRSIPLPPGVATTVAGLPGLIQGLTGLFAGHGGNGGSDPLQKATSDNTNATKDNTRALDRQRQLATSATGGGGGVPGIAGLPGLPGASGGVFSGADSLNQLIFHGLPNSSSTNSSIAAIGAAIKEATPPSGFGGFLAGLSNIGNLNVILHGGQPMAGTNIPAYSTAQRVGAAAGTVGALGAGAYASIQGFERGGARGDLQGVGAALGGAAIFPGPQQPFLAAGALLTGLISSFFGDAKQQREKEISKALIQRQDIEPLPISISTDTSGHYADMDRFGTYRSSEFSPFPKLAEPYQHYQGPGGIFGTDQTNAGYFNVPGQIISPYTPAPASPTNWPQQATVINQPAVPNNTTINYNTNISAMDTQSFFDVVKRNPQAFIPVIQQNSAAVGDSVATHLQSGDSRLANTVRYITSR